MNELDFIKQRSSEYLLEEPDALLRSTIEQLLLSSTEESVHDLTSRMATHVRFGTAGLRGKMEAGYNRLNLVSVYRFAFALAKEFDFSHIKNRSVVVGFDARQHSKQFAEEVMGVLQALGVSDFFV